jgi:hypothetical protein
MKLLIENFRRFINEQESMFFGGEGMSEDADAEKTYFGNISSVAQEIEKVYDVFLEKVKNLYNKNSVEDVTREQVKIEIDFFKDDVEKATGGKAKALGCGAFRCAFDIGDEYVLKFDITPQGTAKDQNKSDASVGRIGKFSDIFPRSIISKEDYRWVALEKATPFKKTINEIKKFIEFFPNSKVDFSKTPEFHYYCVVISFVYHSTSKEAAQAKFDQMKTSMFRRGEPYLKDVSLETIADGFTQSNPYDRIIRVIKEFGIRPEEVRLDNTGIAADGRLVIIDSSIEDEIKKGFGKV